ncbi:exonuclease RNase T and DNA polymerase III [Thelephora ganbajun]|uniref:Exonuclease RNase T and DNA polymerase III n=1 Tax=Thelephora ganbajun TaxID=370292 RepID=A0ACB6ZLV5_THEGA|nr:exonuclease RNase T and DNA polymerase III [Thelephora ganbajun]
MDNRLRYLLVLDFEASCGESGFPKNQMEIIEFPTIVYDLQGKKEVGRFHEYVKPVMQPQLTEFCTGLTGIPGTEINSAEPFPPVCERFKAFLKNQNLWDDPSTYAFITCGAWDLHTMLPRQLSQIMSANPSAKSDDRLLVTHFQERVINIKTTFQGKYGYKHSKEMAQMLGALNIHLVGRHHSGIDDCGNILRIVKRMLDDGWVPEVKPELSR